MLTRTRTPVSAALGAALLVGLGPVDAERASTPWGPPPFRLLLRDGSLVDGRFQSFDPETGVFQLDGRTLRRDDLISVSGPAPVEARHGVVLHFVGGDLLRGELVGGDEAGETVVVRSPVLGDVPVFIDRVARIVFVERIGAGQDDRFAVPDDVDEEEGLFVPARRGFDVIVGAVHRFRPEGVVFEARGDDEPRLRPYADLAGFALRDGEGPEAPMPWQLLTASGDRVGVEWTAAGEEEWTFELESGAQVRLPPVQVAALTPRREDVRFLSDLEPAAVEERSSFGGGDGEVLRPFRRDRSVVGGALRAFERGFGKGIGVHSRSVLTYTVPEGVGALVGIVALDDSVLGLPVRGLVDVRVTVGGEPVFERSGLAAGADAAVLGRLRVAAGQQVEFMVDFGPGLDLGDRVDWLALAFVP